MSRYARSSPQSYTASFGPGPITPAVKWILIANIALFVFAALLFGFLQNLKDQLGILGDKVPGDLLSALPYLATIIAVAGFIGRVRPPAADGQPYIKSD